MYLKILYLCSGVLFILDLEIRLFKIINLNSILHYMTECVTECAKSSNLWSWYLLPYHLQCFEVQCSELLYCLLSLLLYLLYHVLPSLFLFTNRLSPPPNNNDEDNHRQYHLIPDNINVGTSTEDNDYLNHLT